MGTLKIKIGLFEFEVKQQNIFQFYLFKMHF